MRHLYLLRHGKSDWEAPSESDHGRPLAPRGRRAARMVGRVLSRIGQQPDSVVTSTALRAHTTAVLAAEAGGWSCAIRATESLYLPTVEALVEEARREPAAVERLLLVGHEPTWSQAVSALAGGGRCRMVTASLARLDFPVTDWTEIDVGRAMLVWLATPKLLEGASLAGENC